MSAYLLPNNSISFERCQDGSIRVFKQDTGQDGTSITTEVCFIPTGDWNDLVTALGTVAGTGGAPAVDVAPEATPAAIIPASNDPLVDGVTQPAA